MEGGPRKLTPEQALLAEHRFGVAQRSLGEIALMHRTLSVMKPVLADLGDSDLSHGFVLLEGNLHRDLMDDVERNPSLADAIVNVLSQSPHDANRVLAGDVLVCSQLARARSKPIKDPASEVQRWRELLAGEQSEWVIAEHIAGLEMLIDDLENFLGYSGVVSVQPFLDETLALGRELGLPDQ